MRRVQVSLAILALSAVALAGCSSSGDGGSEETSDSADQTLAATAVEGGAPGNLSFGPLVTDMLWLAPAARLNASSVQNLTILATLSGAVPQGFAWNATLNGTGNLSSARLVVWLDLSNSALQPGVGGDPGCTASMTLVVTHNGTATTQPGGCASLGSGMVPPGEHRLEFSTLLTSFPAGALVVPGDGVLVQVAFGLSLPQGVGHILGGADHDSGLRLVGLAEPVGPDEAPDQATRA